jgi:hypothetical protein
MLFPFRTSAIFRNRWVALLWAAGICFMASEIVDSVSGVTGKGAHTASSVQAQDSAPSKSDEDAVAAILQGSPPVEDKPAL